MIDEISLCPECQAQVHPDWFFCTHCGIRIAEYPTIVPLAKLPLQPGEPACENCGASVDTSGSFCWKCGVPLATGRAPFIPAHPEAPAESGLAPESDQLLDLEHQAESESVSRAPRAKRHFSSKTVAGSAILLLGVAIIVFAVLSGWYTYSLVASEQVSGNNYTVSASVTLYPLDQLIETVTCQGGSGCGSINSTFTGSYSQGGADGVGALYELSAGLLLGGIASAIGAVVLAFRDRRVRSRWMGTLAVLSILLVAVAPTLLLIAQPYVITADGAPYTGPGSVNAGSSPRTSFFGSCSGTDCGLSSSSGVFDSGSWGPSLGWYLSYAGLGALFAGWMVIREPREKFQGPITPEMLRKQRYV